MLQVTCTVGRGRGRRGQEGATGEGGEAGEVGGKEPGALIR
jgi:hypothetical protein